jgi:murein DD-endopeptidase MepM/ murein hydrolase activator NlpD
MGKQMTFMVIPHDGRKTITRRVPYWVLGLVLVLLVGVISIVSIFLVQMGSLYRKTLRVDALERRNQELERDHAKLTEIERQLAEIEKMGNDLMIMLGLEKSPPPLDLSELAELGSQLRSGPGEFEFPESEYRFTEDIANFLELQKSAERKIPSGLPFEGWISRRFSTDHPAIDIAGPLLSPIVATADGICTFSGWDERWGNYVEISHSEGIKTLYAHNSKNRVAKGDMITRGDIIAFLGSTGKSTGPHLHYEVSVDQENVDPLSFSIK